MIRIYGSEACTRPSQGRFFCPGQRNGASGPGCRFEVVSTTSWKPLGLLISKSTAIAFKRLRGAGPPSFGLHSTLLAAQKMLGFYKKGPPCTNSALDKHALVTYTQITTIIHYTLDNDVSGDADDDGQRLSLLSCSAGASAISAIGATACCCRFYLQSLHFQSPLLVSTSHAASFGP